MRERELMTRLVKINQSVRKLQSICIDLTGFCDFDSGITGELAQAISETCAMVSPFKSNTVPCANDIGAIVKQYVDAGNMVDNYNYDPDDHYSVLGASMQKYLADEIDRAGLAKEIQDYWANVTPVEH